MCVPDLPQLGYWCNTWDSSIENDRQWSVLAACRPAGEDLLCSASLFRSCLQAGREWPGSEILGCVPDSGGERAVGILHFPALSAPLMCHCLSQSFDSFSRCLLVSAFLFSSSFASVLPISLFPVSLHRELHSFSSPLCFFFFSFFLVSSHSYARFFSLTFLLVLLWREPYSSAFLPPSRVVPCSLWFSYEASSLVLLCGALRPRVAVKTHGTGQWKGRRSRAPALIPSAWHLLGLNWPLRGQSGACSHYYMQLKMVIWAAVLSWVGAGGKVAECLRGWPM